ncbi:MAG: F0F1 ATP synthase subunit A [Gammaproteobacteria bacterium]|nr:F0F1 ATP synthase subunit A [Gammaproteobacteria bacterium]
MQLSPDQIIYAQWGWFKLNATMVNTWLVMAILVGISAFVTRNLRTDAPPNRWRGALEWLVKQIESQIAEVNQKGARHVIYFAGTLFLFIAMANLLVVIPGFTAPTASLSTTAALTICVLLAVPIFSIYQAGIARYLRHFIQPSVFILPFNLIGEFSKAVSLAVRLYGNVMSGAVIVAILLGVAPFFFPVLMELLSMVTGLIQAYIFAILATVYIASATSS